MFDIAYEAEVSIEVAKKTKEKILSNALSIDFSMPFAGLEQIFAIENLNSVIHFYEFIYNTHGGI